MSTHAAASQDMGLNVKRVEIVWHQAVPQQGHGFTPGKVADAGFKVFPVLPYPFILIFRYSVLPLNCATETVLVISLETGWENGSSFNRKLTLCLEIDSISEQNPVKCAGRAGTGRRAWEQAGVVGGETYSPWASCVVKTRCRC